MLLDDALRAVDLVAATDGPIVDVGSGGGTPGIPLAVALPDRHVTLLEAERRKCLFLEPWAAELPNLAVTWGRAEEQPERRSASPSRRRWPSRRQRPSGACRSCERAVSSSSGSVRRPTWSASPSVARQIAGEVVPAPAGLLAIRKTGPTPPGFPRRTGVAKKRPLA